MSAAEKKVLEALADVFGLSGEDARAVMEELQDMFYARVSAGENCVELELPETEIDIDGRERYADAHASMVPRQALALGIRLIAAALKAMAAGQERE